MIHTAIIGLGVIGRVHAQAVAALGPLARLAAGCDANPAKRSALPAGVPVYADYREMLCDLERARGAGNTPVVHICLPHYLHLPVARDCAERGFDIFAEKPLALNAREGEEYAGLEAKHGVRICLCLQNRLNPTTVALLAALRSGEWGQVTGVRGSVAWYRSREYYAEGPWRGLMAQAGGGLMINQAIHTMDLIQLIPGSPMVSVRGILGRTLDYDGVEVEDSAVGHIVFANGARGLFTGSVANFGDENVEIVVRCERGVTFVMRDRALYRKRDGEDEQKIAADSTAFAGKQVYGNSHLTLIKDFYEAIESGSDRYIHPEEGLPSLRMIDAIRESAATGKTVAINAAARADRRAG